MSRAGDEIARVWMVLEGPFAADGRPFRRWASRLLKASFSSRCARPADIELPGSPADFREVLSHAPAAGEFLAPAERLFQERLDLVRRHRQTDVRSGHAGVHPNQASPAVDHRAP